MGLADRDLPQHHDQTLRHGQPSLQLGVLPAQCRQILALVVHD